MIEIRRPERRPNRQLGRWAMAAGLLLTLSISTAQVPDEPEPQPPTEELPAESMTGPRLLQILSRIDPDLESQGNGARFSVNERELMLVFDEAANRMRLILPIVGIEDFPPEYLIRMMQANFDSALDARYAIANEVVWSVFIHPLAELTEHQFVSALAQVVTTAATFGTSFTSGALVYGGGDSSALNEALLRELENALRDEA